MVPTAADGQEFIAAVGRSLLLAGVVLVTILLLMIPTIIWIHLYFLV